MILIDDWMETGGGSLAAPGGGPQDGDDESISEPSLDKDFLTSLRELKVFKIFLAIIVLKTKKKIMVIFKIIH